MTVILKSFILIIAILISFFTVEAQVDLDKKIDLSANDVRLDSMFQLISEETSYFFAYNASIIPDDQKYTLNEKDKSVKYVLNNLLIGTSLEYKVIENQIIILPQSSPSESPVIADRPSHVRVFGVIRDSKSKEPIEGVNVFLSRTMLGDASDPNGFYSIRNVPLGTYEIIFSHVSFGIKSQFVRITEDDDFVLNLDLDKLTQQLDEVEILSRYDKSWERHYRLFEKEFIGSSPSSSRCYILNPEVLDFDFDEDRNLLSAAADDVLIIENQALGYSI
ncbi:MAG: carboxypeptidase-like regulatory domain-containing protein, partial [Bacteroidota bacterium]